MADEKKTCFVVMGFGKKTDFQSGRVLDLDKSYRNIIKPAALAAGLDCKRADEIVHTGIIDVPMYDQLLSADVVVADISTSNANAFYELGVRHALRPYTTITIAEDKMVFQFDVSHLAIRKYHHLGEGIDSEEVDRMRGELTDAMKIILDKPKPDSPIYTFFTDLEPPVRKKLEQAIAQSAPAAISAAAPSAGNDAVNQTMSVLTQRAEAAIGRDDFQAAVMTLTLVRDMAPKDPYVVQRLALATYKSAKPDPLQALLNAKAILDELAPMVSTDTETLGLWGAIHKRLWETSKKGEDLDAAIIAYEKGFLLKNDFYNGINLAFLFNLRASITSGAESIADVVMAERVRRRVLTICDAEQLRASSLRPDQQYWLLATIAEAWTGLGEEAKAQEYLRRAMLLNQPGWMLQSTLDQLEKLKKLMRVAAANA